jgi:hypothetical protein
MFGGIHVILDVDCFMIHRRDNWLLFGNYDISGSDTLMRWVPERACSMPLGDQMGVE